jgi:uncharacterized membrane protein
MMLLALFGCGGPDEAEPMSTYDCAAVPEVTWEGWTHGFATTYCLSCHSRQNVDQRNGAPIEANFDTEAEFAALAPRVRARVLEQGTMPLGGGVQPDDLQLLDFYLTCTLGK